MRNQLLQPSVYKAVAKRLWLPFDSRSTIAAWSRTRLVFLCRAGYRAVLANAVRLAATTADTQALLRTVLSGPQPSPQQAQEQERTLPVESSGLQGYVMKPRYS